VVLIVRLQYVSRMTYGAELVAGCSVEEAESRPRELRLCALVGSADPGTVDMTAMVNGGGAVLKSD
jgi:hypothetical protein